MIVRALRYFVALMLPTIFLVFIMNRGGDPGLVVDGQVTWLMRVYVIASFLIAFLRNTIEKHAAKKGFDPYVLSKGLVGFGLYMGTFYFGISRLSGAELGPLALVGSLLVYALIGLGFGLATKPRDRKPKTPESAGKKVRNAKKKAEDSKPS